MPKIAEIVGEEYGSMTTVDLEKIANDYERSFARELILTGWNGKEAIINIRPKNKRPSAAAYAMRKKPWVIALARKYDEEAAEAVGISKASQLMDLEKEKKDLEWIKKKAGSEGEYSSAVAASRAKEAMINQQNKMLGWHAPTKLADADGGKLPVPQQNTVIILPANGRD